MGVDERDTSFWGTHSGPELDLLVHKGSKKIGFEFKRTVAPKITRSMRVAFEILQLDALILVHAGQESFVMDKNIQAVSASRLETDLPKP